MLGCLFWHWSWAAHSCRENDGRIPLISKSERRLLL